MNKMILGNDNSKSTAWRIMRKKLNWHPYKPYKVVPLTDTQKSERTSFCEWLLDQGDHFVDNVTWSDKK